MNPLYRFDFNEETGQVTKVQIDDYSHKQWNNGEEFYRYESVKGNVKHCYIKRDLDIYKSGRLYTFNPDMKHAKDLIQQRLNCKKNKAQEDYLRYTEMINKLEGWT